MKALDKARRAEQVNADLAEPMRPTSTLGNISGGCQGREVESDFSCEISCLAARHAILPSEGTIASRAIPILAHPTPVPSRFPQRYTLRDHAFSGASRSIMLFRGSRSTSRAVLIPTHTNRLIEANRFIHGHRDANRLLISPLNGTLYSSPNSSNTGYRGVGWLCLPGGLL